MKPLNLDNKPCSPISSNCVVWQGPDIPCIKLCTGDTVSDVVSAMATELCTILDTLKVSNYDLTCFNLQACGPEDFQALIQFLITRICELEGVTPETKDEPACPDCVVSVAECFVTGNQTTMQLVDYVQLIGEKVCSLITEISLINTQITDILIRLTDLENKPDPTFTLPSFTLGCTIGSLTGDQPIDTVLIEFINNVWCDFFSTTGSTADISAAVAQKCIDDTDIQLTTGAPFSANPNWISEPPYGTLADAINNIWVALCDVWDWAGNASISIFDEGSILTTSVSSIDFTGAGVTATNVGNAVTVNVPGASAIADTGWVDLEGFEFMTGTLATSRPQCRRIGNVIHFRGILVIPLASPGGTSYSEPAGSPLILNNNFNDYVTYVANDNIVTPATVDDGIYKGVQLNTQGGSMLVNSGDRVIPSNVLDPTENLDSTYRLPYPFVMLKTIRINDSSGTLTTKGLRLTAAISLSLLSDGKLNLGALKDKEIPSETVNDWSMGTSPMRFISSNIRSGEFVPNFINADTDIHNMPGPAGIHDLRASTETEGTDLSSGLVENFTWPHTCDTGIPENLGGFYGVIDGLTAFVACDATPATADCNTP
jgi:hypothetical protein